MWTTEKQAFSVVSDPFKVICALRLIEILTSIVRYLAPWHRI
jgi:hypothetical protein